MANIKLTTDQQQQIATRFVDGEMQVTLAKDFGVCVQTISKVCQSLKAVRPKAKPATESDMKAFASRVRQILWAQEKGKEQGKSYEKWKARVWLLEAPEGGGLKHTEAIIRASKEFPCLTRVFSEYDVRKFDSDPESHAHIRHVGTPAAREDSVECEGIEQTYRDSLRWAIEAAGWTSRTGGRPTSCPCDAAWYLYEQAVADPKDFLAKVGQVESKGDAELAEKRNSRIAGARSIAEIDTMLSELESEREVEDENVT